MTVTPEMLAAVSEYFTRKCVAAERAGDAKSAIHYAMLSMGAVEEIRSLIHPAATENEQREAAQTEAVSGG